MLLRSNRAPDFFYIDWWLLNYCNYNCSYCADILKSGSINLPDIDHCIDIVKTINQHAKSIKKKTYFQIVGGEITQWPFLKDLLREIKTYDGELTIKSNASCSLIEWKNILSYVDTINMEYHPEFTGESHFLLQISAAAKLDKKCHIFFNMTPEHWDKSQHFFNKIESLFPDLPLHKKILFENPVINTEVKPYNKEQLIELKTNNNSLIFYEDNKETYTDYNKLVLEGKNNFFNRKCNIGIEQIIVDAWGRIARGHCRNGGHIGRLGKGIKFSTEPTICGRATCNNGFDIQATKFV